METPWLRPAPPLPGRFLTHTLFSLQAAALSLAPGEMDSGARQGGGALGQSREYKLVMLGAGGVGKSGGCLGPAGVWRPLVQDSGEEAVPRDVSEP